MLNVYLSLAFGGALGACSRFFVASAVARSFPAYVAMGTLAVNVIGSLLMGILFVLIDEKSQLPSSLKPLLMTGFLGAFTTFSTFSLETLKQLTDGHYLQALSYVLASVVVCVLACFVGMSLTRLL